MAQCTRYCLKVILGCLSNCTGGATNATRLVTMPGSAGFNLVESTDTMIALRGDTDLSLPQDVTITDMNQEKVIITMVGIGQGPLKATDPPLPPHQLLDGAVIEPDHMNLGLMSLDPMNRGIMSHARDGIIAQAQETLGARQRIGRPLPLPPLELRQLQGPPLTHQTCMFPFVFALRLAS